MKALVISAPDTASVEEVPQPERGRDEVLIRVERAGICGTDMELFHGTMPFIAQGRTTYPLRPGHEWSGRVVGLPDDVREDETGLKVGDLVTGDTFIGCGRCDLCARGLHHLCPDHVEIGVLGDRAGALAEFLVVPRRAVHRLPAALDLDLAAMIEPGSCSLRGIRLADVTAGDRVLVWGTGTLGLLAALFAAHAGAAVTAVARSTEDREFARGLGLTALDAASLEGERYDVVVEATGAAPVASRILDHAAPGARIVLLGVPAEPVGIPINAAVALDVTVHAVLGGSSYIDETAVIYEQIGPAVQRLINRHIDLDDVPGALARGLRSTPGSGPKTLVRLR